MYPIITKCIINSFLFHLEEFIYPYESYEELDREMIFDMRNDYVPLQYGYVHRRNKRNLEIDSWDMYDVCFILFVNTYLLLKKKKTLISSYNKYCLEFNFRFHLVYCGIHKLL